MAEVMASIVPDPGKYVDYNYMLLKVICGMLIRASCSELEIDVE